MFPPHVAAFRPGEVGASFTDGFEVVRLVGDEPVTITSIRSVGGEDALQFEGAMIAGTGRKVGAVQELRGFPPSHRGLGELVPAEGAVLDDRDQMGYELLIGYTWASQEADVRAALEIHYESGGESFMQSIPARLVVCPRDRSTESCTEGWR